MACAGCKGNRNTNSGRRGSGGNGDLSRFAFLKPNQLKILEAQQKAAEEEAAKKEAEKKGKK